MKFTWLLILPFLLLQFWQIDRVPGLHYDETWAWTFSHRIASEPGFWPLHAMSPYTSPWTHYWAAPFLRVQDTLLMFRFSQLVLSVLGLVLGAFALFSREQRMHFIFCLSLFPALLLNHRFAIELNGFHVFCLGLFLVGVKQRKLYLWLPALFLGCTSHILFVAVPFALAVTLALEKVELKREERWAILATGILLFAFFLRIAFLIPEKGKALALGFACLLCAIFLWWGVPAIFQKSWWRFFFWPTALFYGMSAHFFFQGVWSVGISTGSLFWYTLPIALPLSLYALWHGWKVASSAEKIFFTVLLTALGVMMLKPTPRYYEIGMLGLAYFFTKGLAKVHWRKFVVVGMGFHAAFLYGIYFTQIPEEKDLHFFVWKDSTHDFLSKQRLVEGLASRGCRLSNINAVNSRILDSLEALSRQDWEVDANNHNCSGRTIQILLPSEVAKSDSHAMTIAGYVIRGF